MLRIAIDTREQQPWAFPEELAKCERIGLLAGDYAIYGDQQFSIERKSVNDLVGTVTSGWHRFLEEIGRMEDVASPAKVVIVEGNLEDILEHRYDHPKVIPRFVVNQIARLTLRGVAVVFAGNPISAAGMAYAILNKRYEQLVEEFESVRDGSNDNDPTDHIPQA